MRFAFKLAKDVAGTTDVKAVLQMSAKRFFMWEAYYQLEPWGDERADWHAASVRQMVHNVAVSRQHQKPIEEFLLRFGKKEDPPAERKQTWQQQLMFMKIIAATQNAFVESGQREAHV